MEVSLINAFCKKTNTPTSIAYIYLYENKWCLQQAIRKWSEETENGQIACDENAISANLYKAFVQEGYFVTSSDFTFSLPQLNIYDSDFKLFMEKDLIEKSVMVSLEQSERLNWLCNEIGKPYKLWALSTTGDGNCLLHAASLAMWGYHDKLLILRTLLHQFLEHGPYTEELKRRWRWNQQVTNMDSGLIYCEEEWINEWKMIKDMASTAKRESSYEGLESIHILALSHILRRAIIVVSETYLRDRNNQPLAPIPFGGVYLPFEIAPKLCHKVPLLLTYDMAHFSALVSMDCSDCVNAPALIPIVDSYGSLLPIKFYYDPGTDYDWRTFNLITANTILLSDKEHVSLLKNYMSIIDLQNMFSSDVDSEEEIEKRFTEISDLNDNDPGSIFNNKNKAAKQLQVLGKQFGSIGKSMSKKLKINFGPFTKIIKTRKYGTQRPKILCAEIHPKLGESQEMLTVNYLKLAQERFIKICINEFKAKTPGEELLKMQALEEGPLPCITVGCENYSSSLTSYLCNNCFALQKIKEEANLCHYESHYGTGKSKFYRESDLGSYEAVRNLPVRPPYTNNDQTLYLSNSTFYNDSDKESPLNAKFSRSAPEIDKYMTDRMEIATDFFESLQLMVRSNAQCTVPSPVKINDNVSVSTASIEVPNELTPESDLFKMSGETTNTMEQYKNIDYNNDNNNN